MVNIRRLSILVGMMVLPTILGASESKDLEVRAHIADLQQSIIDHVFAQTHTDVNSVKAVEAIEELTAIAQDTKIVAGTKTFAVEVLKGLLDMTQGKLEAGIIQANLEQIGALPLQASQVIQGDIEYIVHRHATQAKANAPSAPQYFVIEDDTLHTSSLEQSTTHHQDSVMLWPSLQQKLTVDGKEDVTNYCGYYALWNAYCWANNLQDIRCNREQFTLALGQMLERVKTSPSVFRQTMMQKKIAEERFGELESFEVIEFMRRRGMPHTIFVGTQNLFIAAITGDHNYLSNEDEHALRLIEQFRAGIITRIIIIVVTGSHYFTISADKHNATNTIRFHVADSAEGSSVSQEVLQSKIMPFYFVLKGSWEKLDAVHATRFEIQEPQRGVSWEEFQAKVNADKH